MNQNRSGVRLLGVDAGSTVTKATVFDEDGTELGSHALRVIPDQPAPHHVERDQDALWHSASAAIRGVLDKTGTDPRTIAALAVTAHGDGVYLVDDHGRPTRPGIMSLDTRARDVADRWQADGTADEALRFTGQRPWASAPAALLAWLAEHEPDVLARTRFALPCKDMLRQRLTGQVFVDPTEASLSFTDVATQAYDDAILDLYGLSRYAHLRAPIHGCADLAGTVTAAAAADTGLLVGTPVATGAHDVDCSAIGSGVREPGTASVVAGSFSINQVVSLTPQVGEGWMARSFVEPGRWLNMSISPTSATNLEWFTQTLCPAELQAGGQVGDPFGFVEDEIAAVADDPRDVVYLPFLFGSPLAVDASAGFLGIRGWHGRGHLLRAVLDGVACTHRDHVDVLAARFGVEVVRLTGGATRSRRWSQIIADLLARPVEVTTAAEAGALGCAQLAGIAAGVYPDLPQAIARTVRVRERFEPGLAAADLNRHYARYRALVTALTPTWA